MFYPYQARSSYTWKGKQQISYQRRCSFSLAGSRHSKKSDSKWVFAVDLIYRLAVSRSYHSVEAAEQNVLELNLLETLSTCNSLSPSGYGFCSVSTTATVTVSLWVLSCKSVGLFTPHLFHVLDSLPTLKDAWIKKWSNQAQAQLSGHTTDRFVWMGNVSVCSLQYTSAAALTRL